MPIREGEQLFSLTDLTKLGNLERPLIFTNVKLSALHSYFSNAFPGWLVLYRARVRRFVCLFDTGSEVGSGISS